jgi:transcriptional regulator with GAF, ATPase, and Fis domain
LGKDISFHPEAEKLMQSYSWKGNIRELRNVIEYLVSLDKNIIEKDDLPFTNVSYDRDLYVENNNNLMNDLILKFILKEGSKIDLYRDILIELEKSYNNRERIGRNKLMNMFKCNNLFYSEQEIRTCLNKLDSFGFIISKKGRAGSVITPSGIQLKNKIIILLDYSS